MTETCAYIAGLLDADGSICMHRTNKGKPYEGCNWMINIVNRDLLVLQWVQSMFGGAVRKRRLNRKASHARNWSQTYDWNPSVEGVEYFLVSILPFLRIKRRQAEIVLEFLKTRKIHREQFRLTPEIRGRREELYTEIKGLNRYGQIPIAMAEEVN